MFRSTVPFCPALPDTWGTLLLDLWNSWNFRHVLFPIGSHSASAIIIQGRGRWLWTGSQLAHKISYSLVSEKTANCLGWCGLPVSYASRNKAGVLGVVHLQTALTDVSVPFAQSYWDGDNSYTKVQFLSSNKPYSDIKSLILDSVDPHVRLQQTCTTFLDVSCRSLHHIRLSIKLGETVQTKFAEQPQTANWRLFEYSWKGKIITNIHIFQKIKPVPKKRSAVHEGSID